MNEILQIFSDDIFDWIPIIIAVLFISFLVSFILLIKPERRIDYENRHINIKK